MTVRFTGPFRQLAGRDCDEIDVTAGTSLRAVLTDIAGRLPDGFVRAVLPDVPKQVPTTIILVNRQPIHAEWLDRPLQDGDIVAFVPPMAGG